MSTARFLVSGKVQGVFYRVSTREQSLALGLTGQALNLVDGRVDVLASGSDAALDALEAWLWQGPSAARVDAVERTALPAQAFDGFHTG